MDMIAKADALLVRLREALRHLRHENHKAVARAAVGAHLTYYILVFFEAHGNYGYAAGACGIILVIEVLLGGKEDK